MTPEYVHKDRGGAPTLKTLLYNTTEKKAFHSPKGNHLNPVNVTNQKYRGCRIPQLFNKFF